MGEGKRTKDAAENTKWLKSDDCDCRGREKIVLDKIVFISL